MFHDKILLKYLGTICFHHHDVIPEIYRCNKSDDKILVCKGNCTNKFELCLWPTAVQTREFTVIFDFPICFTANEAVLKS